MYLLNLTCSCDRLWIILQSNIFLICLQILLVLFGTRFSPKKKFLELDFYWWYFHFMQIVCELPASTNWNFDVHWYPKVPGVISASSFDVKIGIYNIEVKLLISPTRSQWVPFRLTLQCWYLEVFKRFIITGERSGLHESSLIFIF